MQRSHRDLRKRQDPDARLRRIVDELAAAARQLGVEVRLETGNFRGGWCRVDGADLVVLNKRHLPEVHLALLADALGRLPVETVYLRPAARAALEAAWARAASSEVPHEASRAAAPTPHEA